jgi:hypothetical protein
VAPQNRAKYWAEEEGRGMQESLSKGGGCQRITHMANPETREGNLPIPLSCGGGSGWGLSGGFDKKVPGLC